MRHTVSKSAFKAKALQYLGLVEETGEELIVTDHGQPVLRVLAYRAPSAGVSLRGSVRHYVRPLDPVMDSK